MKYKNRLISSARTKSQWRKRAALSPFASVIMYVHWRYDEDEKHNLSKCNVNAIRKEISQTRLMLVLLCAFLMPFDVFEMIKERDVLLWCIFIL